jgi:centrosomal protein CEP164
VASDSIILEEEIDPNYVPSEDEVLEYAKWLGMDLQHDTVRRTVQTHRHT